MPLVAVVFGWPAVVVSTILTLAGIALMRRSLAIAGVVTGAPFLFYLSMTPRFQWVAPVVAFLYFFAAYAVAHRQQGAALALASPFVVLAVFVARLVLGQ